MDPSWEVFVSHMLQKPRLIKVDTALGRFAPLQSDPFAVMCSITGLPATKKLLPTEASIKQIATFETKAKAIAHGTGTYVGRFSSGDLTAFHFYTPDAGVLIGKFETSAELRGIASFRCRANEDREWKWYRHLLYQEPKTRTQILNNGARRRLSLEGDDGRKSRTIVHSAHFWTGEELSNYLEFLKDEGYVIRLSSKKPGSSGAWLVIFAKHQTPASLDVWTQGLMEKAVELNGVYDGWRPRPAETP
jgi:hypothetical protein